MWHIHVTKNNSYISGDASRYHKSLFLPLQSQGQEQYLDQDEVTPDGMDLLQETWKIFAFSVISQNWDVTGSWNPSSLKTRTCGSCIGNTIAADVLAMQGAKASAAMGLSQLTCFSRNILVSAPEALKTHYIEKLSLGASLNVTIFPNHCYQSVLYTWRFSSPPYKITIQVFLKWLSALCLDTARTRMDLWNDVIHLSKHDQEW